jgi:hypothetical protein
MRIAVSMLALSLLSAPGRIWAQGGDAAQQQKLQKLEDSAAFLERTTEDEYQDLAADVLPTLKPADQRHAVLASAALESVYATLAIFEFGGARDSNGSADKTQANPPLIKVLRAMGEQLVHVSTFEEAPWWTALHEALDQGATPDEMKPELTTVADPKSADAHEDLERSDKALYSPDISDSDKFATHLARAQDYIRLMTAARSATIAAIKRSADILRTRSAGVDVSCQVPGKEDGIAVLDVRLLLQEQYEELARLELENVLSMDPTNAEARKDFDALTIGETAWKGAAGPTVRPRKKTGCAVCCGWGGWVCCYGGTCGAAVRGGRGIDEATAARLAELVPSDAGLKAARAYEEMASVVKP